MSEKVCQICFGREVVELEETHHGIPITTPCKCAIARDIVKNLDRGWVGISKAESLKSSPLLEKVSSDLYITATDTTLKAHLKYVGVKMGRNWSFQVVSDADLMSSWLASAKLAGKEILDPDVALGLEKLGSEEGRLMRVTLEDLVEPPGLLILWLGVKRARNAATNEVFLEALTLRDHINRPTWVVDQPAYRLNQGDHLCYSDKAAEIINEWEYLVLDLEDKKALKVKDLTPSQAVAKLVGRNPTVSLSSASGAVSGGTSSAPRPDENVEKPTKWKGPRKS